MQRISLSRGALVLGLLALAACEAPTLADRGAADPSAARPARNLPVAQMTVTNSGGTPLVSWNAVPGATSYTVRLISYRTSNGNYVGRSFQTLTTTTSTSYLSTSHTYTGTYQCTFGFEDRDGNVRGYWYEYEVVSHFPTGTSSARHFAPITDEDCGFL